MIGLVGPAEAIDRLAGAIDAPTVVAASASALLAEAPSAVVCVGPAALSELVEAGVDVPVLGVEDATGAASVDAEAVPGLLEALLDGGVPTRVWPVVEARVDGRLRGRGVYDVMVVTAEPARISEYRVETPGGTDELRADGVVVATAAGSAGYARALGGPVLDPGADCLVVVPVAAFSVRSTVRVAEAGSTLSVSVLRDEGAITLLVDGVDRGVLEPNRPVTVGVADRIEVVVPPSP